MSCFETSLDLLRPFAEPDLLLHPLLFQGIMLHLSGEVDQAGTVMSEALACARQAGNRWFEAYAIYNLGYIASLHGQYEQGYQQMGQGLAIWRAIGEPRSIALGLNYMSPTVIRLGRFDEAQRILEEALALCEQVDDRWGKGSAVRFTGLLALEKGDAGAAEQLFRRSLEIFGDYVIGWDIIRAVIYRGEAVYQLGRLEEARRILSCALVQAQDAHSLPLALDALAALAEVHLRQGAAAQAWRIAAFVAAHPTAPYEARQRAGRVCSQVSACQAGAAGVCEGELATPATLVGHLV
jgi:tetratricopeptide (TPR) repeat protein